MDKLTKKKQATTDAQEPEPDYRGIGGKASLNAKKANIKFVNTQTEENKQDEESPLIRGI
ncbi:hypothetical protein [Pedobacter agri]|uniref:hypothetical protein n=1 Tax=Pedobacter agri TaxID=454586 RepID=UPI00292E943F|nr:hypothetical protein [Pedobacter agri]